MEHALASLFLKADVHLFSGILVRLLLAAALGGFVGLEREIKHRSAGLRTNMFICIGAALFTALSMHLGGTNDATRIASQIIPGIGFIGAGSILRGKTGVTGLTTAATIFVVASIGMACGGGLYLTAVFSTVLVLIVLLVLGWAEKQFSLKAESVTFTIVGDKSVDELLGKINDALDSANKHMQSLQTSTTNGKSRIVFSVECTLKEENQFAQRLQRSPDLHNFEIARGETD